MAGAALGMPFERTGPFPVDESLVKTKAEMLATVDAKMPDVYFAMCKDDKKLYTYDKSDAASQETGKYSIVEGGGVPVGGTTGQILAKASDDDGDATWVDDQGAFLMAEECEYGSHTETREVEVEYYTWDRTSLGPTSLPTLTNREAILPVGTFNPAKMQVGNGTSIDDMWTAIKNSTLYRAYIGNKLVEISSLFPFQYGNYYFYDFKIGGTTYYVRTNSRTATEGIFVKNNMFTKDPPFETSDAVDILAIAGSPSNNYFEQYTRHTRTETREVEVPDYIHNVSCIVKNDLNLDPRAIPSGWGIASVITTPTIATNGTYTVDISSYGLTSENDYQVTVIAENPTSHIQVPVDYVNIRNRTATSFVIANTSSEYPFIAKVTLVAKGYGYNVSGWGIATSDVIRVNKSSTDTQTTIDVSGFGFASANDYQVVFETVGGGNMDWGSTIYFLTSKTATSFRFNARNASSNQDYVMVGYTIFAKGYGGSGGGGLPSGGVKGDIIVKQSSADGDVEWTPLDVSEWGVAKTGVATVTFDNSQWSDNATVSIADLNLSSNNDYTTLVEPASGGTAGAWGSTTAHVGSQTNTEFVVGGYSDTNVSGTLNIKYVVFAKGYGTTVGGSGGSIDVDTEMSDTSENAVQNKVIKAYVDGADKFLFVPTDQDDWQDVPAQGAGVKGVELTTPYTYEELVASGKQIAVKIDSTSENADSCLVILQHYDDNASNRQFYGYSTYVDWINGEEHYYIDTVQIVKQTLTDKTWLYHRTSEIEGGGGGGTVDQSYNAYSTNAQSGTAVAEAIADMASYSADTSSAQYRGIVSHGNDSLALTLDTDTVGVTMASPSVYYSEKVLPTKGYVDDQTGDLTALTTTAQTDLVSAINEIKSGLDNIGEPFRVKQWASNTLDVAIPYCTEDIGNTSIPKMVFTIDDTEGADYQIVGMISYELFDAASGGNRINAWPVCQFTGNGQKELGVRWMCGGTTRKTAKRISAWVLLKHR